MGSQRNWGYEIGGFFFNFSVQRWVSGRSLLQARVAGGRAWGCGHVQEEPSVSCDSRRDKTGELSCEVLQCSLYCVGKGKLLNDVEGKNDMTGIVF